MGAAASQAWAGGVVFGVALAWVVVGAVTGFKSPWLGILSSVTSIVTVVMLFAIQHMQNRDQQVVQRKLDEILRAVPQADNQLIALEEAPDEEIEALSQHHPQSAP
jgi:low affinity Fe/Cu permease